MKRLLHNLFYTVKWNVGVAKMPVADFLGQPKNVEVAWMKESKANNFYADPFAFVDNDKIEIYFEEFIGSKRKAFISKSVFANNSFSSPEKIFESEVHLSYPFVFEFNNKKYCLPETHELNEIALYELLTPTLSKGEGAVTFKKVKVLIENFAGVDSTLVQWNNRWWLFCANKMNKRVDVDLYIFYADDLLGIWNPHPANPVKSDRNSARPGGTPFIHDRKLFRPSQDSSAVYGGRIVINEIIKLNEKEFKENPVAFVEPSQLNGIYKDGLHTLSAAGNYTVVDAKRRVFTLRNLFTVLRKKLS